MTIPVVDDNIVKLACGNKHAMILTEKGLLYAYGSNFSGQLGTGDRVDRGVVTQIDLIHLNIQNVFCGSSYTLALTTDGSLYATGFNSGQLGLGDTDNRVMFTRVPIENVLSVHVSCVSASTMIVTRDGIYSCGNNEYGQLGTGDTMRQNLFTKIDMY